MNKLVDAVYLIMTNRKLELINNRNPDYSFISDLNERDYELTLKFIHTHLAIFKYRLDGEPELNPKPWIAAVVGNNSALVVMCQGAGVNQPK